MATAQPPPPDTGCAFHIRHKGQCGPYGKPGKPEDARFRLGERSDELRQLHAPGGCASSHGQPAPSAPSSLAEAPSPAPALPAPLRAGTSSGPHAPSATACQRAVTGREASRGVPACRRRTGRGRRCASCLPGPRVHTRPLPTMQPLHDLSLRAGLRSCEFPT